MRSGSTADLQHWPAARIGEYLDIGPRPDTGLPDSFNHRFLGRESGGQGLGRPRFTPSGHPLLWAEQSVGQCRCAAQREDESGNRHNIEAHADDRHAQATPGVTAAATVTGSPAVGGP